MLRKVEFGTSAHFGRLYVNFNGIDIECRLGVLPPECYLEIIYEHQYYDLKEIKEVE